MMHKGGHAAGRAVRGQRESDIQGDITWTSRDTDTILCHYALPRLLATSAAWLPPSFTSPRQRCEALNSFARTAVPPLPCACVSSSASLVAASHPDTHALLPPKPPSSCLTSSASLVAASRADLGMKRFVGTAAAPSRCLPIRASASSSVAAALRLQGRKCTRQLKQ